MAKDMQNTKNLKLWLLPTMVFFYNHAYLKTNKIKCIF